MNKFGGGAPDDAEEMAYINTVLGEELLFELILDFPVYRFLRFNPFKNNDKSIDLNIITMSYVNENIE